MLASLDDDNAPGVLVSGVQQQPSAARECRTECEIRHAVLPLPLLITTMQLSIVLSDSSYAQGVSWETGKFLTTPTRAGRLAVKRNFDHAGLSRLMATRSRSQSRASGRARSAAVVWAVVVSSSRVSFHLAAT